MIRNLSKKQRWWLLSIYLLGLALFVIWVLVTAEVDPGKALTQEQEIGQKDPKAPASHMAPLVVQTRHDATRTTTTPGFPTPVPVQAPPTDGQPVPIPEYDNSPKTIQLKVVDAFGGAVPSFPVGRWQGPADAPWNSRTLKDRNGILSDANGLVEFSETPKWNIPDPWNPRHMKRTWHAKPVWPYLRECSIPLVRKKENMSPIELRLPHKTGLRFELVTGDHKPFLDTAKIELRGKTLPTLFWTVEKGVALFPSFPPDLEYSFLLTNQSGFQRIEESHPALGPATGWKTHQLVMTGKVPVLVGRLLYPTGEPMKNQKGFLEPRTVESGWLETDNLGKFRYSLYGTIPSDFAILMREPAHYTATIKAPSNIQPGENQVGDIYLQEKPCALQGTIAWKDGLPMPWAKLVVDTLPPTKGRNPGDWDCMSGKQGQFFLYKELDRSKTYVIRLSTPLHTGDGKYDLPNPVPFVIGQRGLALKLVRLPD